MLDCRRCTLTHSCGWAVELGLGLVAMEASSDAETVLDAVDPPGDEDADPDPDEPDPDGEGDRFSDADGELG